MRKMLNKLRTNRKGFTFIELCAVIAIILILCALAIPSINGARDRARIVSDKTSIQTMNNAIALHCVVNGTDNLLGMTSINVVQPIKNGDSVTTIMQFLKDNRLIEDRAQIYFVQGKTYISTENKVGGG